MLTKHESKDQGVNKMGSWMVDRGRTTARKQWMPPCIVYLGWPKTEGKPNNAPVEATYTTAGQGNKIYYAPS